jgi:hypothetical protein
MENYKINYKITVDSERTLYPNEVKIINEHIHNIISQKKEGTFELPNLVSTIEAKELLPYGKEIDAPISETGENIIFSDEFPVKIPDFYKYHQFGCGVQVRRDTLYTAKSWNYRFIGFRMGQLKPRSIVGNIRDAASQISENTPGIVYIDLNRINRNMKEEELNQLNTSIINQLRFNTKISTLVITAEYVTSSHGFTEFKDAIYVVKNPNAKIKIENFLLPRENLSSLNSLISKKYLD